VIRVLAAVLLAAAVAACSPQPSPAPPPPTGTAVATTAPGALRTVHDPGTVTGTLTGPCRARDGGQLPDPTCTPGAFDPAVTAAVLCSRGYRTSSYRPPAALTDRFKYQEAYPAYGVAGTARTELDHLVSLELGGANDAANLWPESPPSPNPKDRIEGVLHAWVCAVTGAAGQARLVRAQAAIARDWLTAESVLGIGAS
jgi:hypothetical protein